VLWKFDPSTPIALTIILEGMRLFEVRGLHSRQFSNLEEVFLALT
jgi:hypothetical protein